MNNGVDPKTVGFSTYQWIDGDGNVHKMLNSSPDYKFDHMRDSAMYMLNTNNIRYVPRPAKHIPWYTEAWARIRDAWLVLRHGSRWFE